MHLKRAIGIPALLLTAIGGMVGSGWLFGPYFAAQVTGPAAVVSWLLGGVLILFIALTFTELATMFPVAGGMVRFGEISHGPIVGFTITWISWLSAVCVAPIETLAIIQYSSNFFPHLISKTASGYVLTNYGLIVSALLLLSMCTINAFGAKVFAKTNSTIVIWKLAIPLFVVIFFITHRFYPENFYAYGGFAPYGIKSVLAALPTAGVILSFIGFSPAIQLAGEAKNPSKALPIALIGAITICALLYFIIQFAFIGAVDPSSLINGWAQLHFVGDTGPFAGMAIALGSVWFVKLLYLDALISPYGTGLTYTSATARINYAAGYNGYFPHFFTRLNKYRVPHLAILANFVIGMLLFLPFPGWQDMVGFIVTAFVIVYGIGPIALISLRKTMPDAKRPFRLPAANIMALFAFYICNLMLLWTGWHTISRLLVIIAFGYLYLALFRQTKAGQKLELQWANAYWLPPHFVGIGLISYLSTFAGGINVIPFGWDFIVTAVFSVIIFAMATNKKHLRKPVAFEDDVLVEVE